MFRYVGVSVLLDFFVFFFSSHLFSRAGSGCSCFTGQLPGMCHLLDRALAATVAAKGLYFRADNSLGDLLNDDLLVDSCDVRPHVRMQEIGAAPSNQSSGIPARIGRREKTFLPGMIVATNQRNSLSGSWMWC